jgi:hypothetical protein
MSKHARNVDEINNNITQVHDRTHKIHIYIYIYIYNNDSGKPRIQIYITKIQSYIKQIGSEYGQ